MSNVSCIISKIYLSRAGESNHNSFRLLQKMKLEYSRYEKSPMTTVASK
jgi:hypothetical protein